MEAKELRVGNWFVAGKTPYPSTVLTIEYDLNEGFIINRSIPISYMNAIPLTPELLEKAGFEHTIVNTWGGLLDGDSRYSIGKISFMHIENDWFLFGWNDDLKAINYLHQLQNIFYYLTGEELTINF